MQELVKIICKILAIFFGIEFLTNIPNSFVGLEAVKNQSSSTALLLVIVTPLIYLAISAVLWMLSDRIAQIIVGKDSALNGISNINFERLQAGAFSVVGILSLSNAIPGLSRVISNILMTRAMNQDYNLDKVSINIKAQAIGFGVQILIGLVLLFGAKGIVNLIKMTRDFGLETNQKDE